MADQTIKFILLQLPLVGGTLLTVMTAYGLKKIVGSKYITDDQKLEDVLKEISKVGMSIGITVGGTVIGQIAIPIPVVGAIIGGVIGGAISSVMNLLFDKVTAKPPIP